MLDIRLFLRMRSLRTQLTRSLNELGPYSHCNKCGEDGIPSRIKKVTDAKLAAHLGTEVSARLWYCPQCQRAFCVACSEWFQESSTMGIRCRRCHGSYDRDPPPDLMRPLLQKVNELAAQLDQLEPGAGDKCYESWTYRPR